MKTYNFRTDPNYWDQKLANYLHDPPDKALRIPGHEERSIALLDILGNLPTPTKDSYQRADVIAAGMDRTQLPGYSQDIFKNGAIDFGSSPYLTHPTGEQSALQLGPWTATENDIAEVMRKIVEDDIDGCAGAQRPIGLF